MSQVELDPKRWIALALVGAAFFMTVLDTTVVNVALPTIQTKLNFSDTNLQWVITAYGISFGGLLLLGGRAADLMGRRRVFLGGLALFTIASLVAGLAQSSVMLIILRAVQGAGAAIVAPSSLSIVGVTFEEGAERNKALGIYGALAGSGAAVGVLLGGVLTSYLGWEWIFFINVPVGVLVFLLTPRYVRESRLEAGHRAFDPLGAVTITTSLVLLVYAISKAPTNGWGSAQTIGCLLGFAALLVAFLVIESRSRHPLMRLGIFRVGTVSGANVVGFMLNASLICMFFLLTLYVQQILHYSAIKAGVTFLATAGTAVLASGAGQALVTRFGVRAVLVPGMVLMAAGMFLFTRLPVDGSFASNLLVGYLLVGVGIGFAYVPVSIAALGGVSLDEEGLASGLINTSQQVGGALGVAVASTIFIERANNVLANLHAQVTTSYEPDDLAYAFTQGYKLAFWVVAFAAAVAGALAAILMVRGPALAPDEDARVRSAPVGAEESASG
jgi:EmrB/QacA subfamily drug resistance transporter